MFVTVLLYTSFLVHCIHHAKLVHNGFAFIEEIRAGKETLQRLLFNGCNEILMKTYTIMQ